MKPYFPMFVNLSHRRALVVGAGSIAARRVKTLAVFCDDITVVAPEIAPDLEGPGVTLLQRPFQPSDLEGMDLVLAATDDAALNADIAAACRARGVPVNVASDQRLCDFFFPGVAVSGPVVAGVTASGTDHALARRATEVVREALEGVNGRGREQGTGNREQE